MTSSFKEDLYNLTLNNNYLLELPNRKTNENVLIIKYVQPVASSTTRFINPISTNTIEYKNSLNYNANQYGINTDLKILTYLYFSDNEQNYQFRVTNGSTYYPGQFTMYLNNYQYKIFDNTATNKISNMDIIKKGVYLLCLEIPYNASRFKIEYSNDAKTWWDLDNLIISKFTSTLDKKTLIDTFLISGLNYCNKDNINSTTCNDFYKNIEDITVQTYLDEIQTSIYPTPIDGSYTNFDNWSINDTNFQNIENINPLPTNRNNFKCGLQTTRTRVRTYFPPKYGGNPNLEDTIYKIESKKPNMLFIKNMEGAYLSQQEIKDITCYTPNEINTQWKNIGCTTIIPPNNNTLKYLSYNADFANIKTNIDKWSDSKLLNTNDITLIQQCYGNDGYLVVKNNRSNNKLYQGTEINNENGTIDIEVLVNSNFKIIFQKDGNLVLYNGTIEPKNAIWSTKTDKKGGTKLRMQHDGNLVLYTDNNTSLWNSKTSNNPSSFAELLSNGRFVIRNNKNTTIKYLLTKEFGGDNIYFSGSNNWKYAKNNSTSGILSDWKYYSKDGSLTVIKGNITLKNDTQPWGMTDKDSSNDDRKTTGMNIPQTINGVKNVIDIALLSYEGYISYINVEEFKNSIDSNKTDSAVSNNWKKDSTGCTDWNIAPVVYNYITNYNILSTNSDANKKINIYTNPAKFEEKDGGTHDDDNKYNGCTQFWNLYNNSRLSNEKNIIKNQNFEEGDTNIESRHNWIGDEKGRYSSSKARNFRRYWRVYYRTQENYVNYLNSLSSYFTNKYMFTNKLKATLLENYENPQCNLENILTDSNCNSLEINIYKNYINNMNKYCTYNWVNSINPECVNYYNKSFTDTNGQSIKIDVEGKLKLLEIQEKTCNYDKYFLNDRCIELNYYIPKIIEYQAKVCSDSKNKDLCDELTKKYTNQVKKNISVNMLNDNKEVLYKNNLEKEILYLKCNENNNNVLLNNCNRLINDPNISEQQKINLINRKNMLCIETNINHPECIKYNKENPNILNELKNRCLQNKSDDCKEFCKNNKYDEEFKKTDFYKEVCYSWIEEFWWIILLIVLATLGGGFIYFKKKKTINSNINTNNDNNDKKIT